MKNIRKLVTALLILTVVAVLPLSTFAQEPEARTSGMRGGEPIETGVQLQNVGTAETTAKVVLVKGDGSRIELADQKILGGSAINYYLPLLKDREGRDISPGSYAMVAEADQPLQAIVATEYKGNGAAAIYGSVDPAMDVTVPIVFYNWGGQNSQLTVQNASSGNDEAEVTIQIIGRLGIGKGQKADRIPPGASRTYQVDPGTFGISPNTGDMETPKKEPAAGSGFIGYARVTSKGAPVVVQSFIDIEGSPAVAAFSGVDTNNAAATTIFAPLLRSNFFGDTGLQLVNTTDKDANVTITYYTDPVAKQYVQPSPNDDYKRTATVNKNDSLVDFHGPKEAAPYKVLPDGTRPESPKYNPDITGAGWFGVAKIESNVPLIGVVQDVSFNADWSTANQANYNIVTAAQAGTEFAVPMARANWAKRVTGVQVQNITPQEIEVQITYSVNGYNSATGRFDAQLPQAPPLKKTVAPFGAANLYQGDPTEMAKYPSGLNAPEDWGLEGWFGSAIVKVNTPGGKIVALVNDAGYNAPGDNANFNAIKLKD